MKLQLLEQKNRISSTNKTSRNNRKMRISVNSHVSNKTLEPVSIIVISRVLGDDNLKGAPSLKHFALNPNEIIVKI